MPSWEERRQELDWISSFAGRYHARRHSFLDGMAKLEPVLSLIFGSAAFGSAVAGLPKVAAGAALIVASYSAMNLSFGFAGCAVKHEQLLKRWSKFRAKLVSIPNGDELALRELEADKEAIDADSPDQLQLLSAIGEDEERLARGDDPQIKVPWFWRQAANFFSLDWERFRRA